jgi:CRP-like cAMP-binding protein
MSEALKKHILKFIDVDTDQLDDITAYFAPVEVKKKANLLVKGKICTSNYFVVNGCLRLFFVNDKGVEQTTQFAIENWWLSDYASFSTKKPSEFFIQAVEKKTQVLGLTFSNQEKLLKRHPAMERYFRLIHQRAHAAAQFRIRSLYSVSREDAYFQFRKEFPEFVNRVPQYLLASYLGFTPEYLSEIRSKRRS